METTTAYIYKITNKIDGKSYVGFASTWQNFIKRKSVHKKASGLCPKFHAAINKYGWDNFECEILFESWDKQWCLNTIEPFLIKQFGDYNLTEGGEGVFNIKHTDEFKEKMRKRMTGKNNPFYGKKHPEKLLNQISEKLKGRPSPKKGTIMNEESKKKMRNSAIERFKNNIHPMLGKKFTEESKEKMRQAKLGKKLSIEHIDKLKNRKITNETRLKLSLAAKENWRKRKECEEK